jgi:hypothetical protein
VQKFDTLYVSPLTRATQTADIITTGMGLRSVMLPSLREIDLYSFQVMPCSSSSQPVAAVAAVNKQQDQEAAARTAAGRHAPTHAAPAAVATAVLLTGTAAQ